MLWALGRSCGFQMLRNGIGNLLEFGLSRCNQKLCTHWMLIYLSPGAIDLVYTLEKGTHTNSRPKYHSGCKYEYRSFIWLHTQLWRPCNKFTVQKGESVLFRGNVPFKASGPFDTLGFALTSIFGMVATKSDVSINAKVRSIVQMHGTCEREIM